MEISNFTAKCIREIASAASYFTPENIKACAIAEADGLKLTEPERKKRDECVTIINSVDVKLEELDAAENKNARDLKAIADAQKTLDEREAAFTESCKIKKKAFNDLVGVHADDVKKHKEEKDKFNNDVVEFERQKNAHELEKQRFADSKKEAKEQIAEAQAKIAAA